MKPRSGQKDKPNNRAIIPTRQNTLFVFAQSPRDLIQEFLTIYIEPVLQTLLSASTDEKMIIYIQEIINRSASMETDAYNKLVESAYPTDPAAQAALRQLQRYLSMNIEKDDPLLRCLSMIFTTATKNALFYEIQNSALDWLNCYLDNSSLLTTQGRKRYPE